MAWIVKIASNYAYKVYHKNKRAAAAIAQNQQIEQDGEEQAIERILIHEIFQILTKQEQVLLMMRYWLDMSYREIGASLHRTAGSTRQAIESTLSKIKKYFTIEEFLHETKS